MTSRVQAASARIAATSAAVPFEGAPLSVMALSLCDMAGRRLLLVAADVIWFSDQSADRLRTAIARGASLDEACVILAASHTHGSPQPDVRFPFGRRAPDWVARFEAAAVDAAARAASAPVSDVALMQGRAQLGVPAFVNRRRMAWYRNGARLRRRVQSLPDAARPVDHDICTLAARDPDGRIQAIIVHAACHPVALPRDAAGADFPGVVRERLQARYGSGVPVLFLQGHCGDVRPRLIRKPSSLKDHALELLIGPRFRPSRAGDAELIGNAVADAALRAIETARPIAADLAAAAGGVTLVDDTGAPVGRALDITAWRLAPDLHIVAASGEMLSGLASPDPGVLSVGYANGMAGYIAPESEYAGGGYEIDGFLKPFGLSRRFSPDTGQRFVAERTRLLAEVGSATTQPTKASAA